MEYELNIDVNDVTLGKSLSVVFKKFPTEKEVCVPLRELFSEALIQKYLTKHFFYPSALLPGMVPLSADILKRIAQWLRSVTLQFSLSKGGWRVCKVSTFLSSIFGGLYLCSFPPALLRELKKEKPVLREMYGVFIRSIPSAQSSIACPPEIHDRAVFLQNAKDFRKYILPLKSFSCRKGYNIVIGTRIYNYGMFDPNKPFPARPDVEYYGNKIFGHHTRADLIFDKATTDFGVRTLIYSYPEKLSSKQIKRILNG